MKKLIPLAIVTALVLSGAGVATMVSPYKTGVGGAATKLVGGGFGAFIATKVGG